MGIYVILESGKNGFWNLLCSPIHVIAICVCVATVLFAMLCYAKFGILKPPPMKQSPAQVPKTCGFVHDMW